MLIHDVSPGRPVNQAAFSAALGAALRFGGGAAVESGRYDSDGRIGLADTVEAYHRHMDGLAIGALGQGWRMPSALRELALRSDALPSGAGGFPRDFEYIRTSVLEEKRQPLTAMQFLPLDSSVPLGARTHTARRALGSGEAQLHRGGSEIPRATVTYAEESFGIGYVVCAVDQNLFDSFSLDFAGLQQYQQELRLATRLVEEKVNRIAWFGDVGANLYGVLNYPSVAKTVLSTSFVAATAAADILTALIDFVTTPIVESGGTFAATHLLISPKIARVLSSRLMSVGSNMFLIDAFLAGQRLMANATLTIGVAPELAGAGIGGLDAMIAYRQDLDTIAHVVPQLPTVLPVTQTGPLDQTTVVFASTGGVAMFDVGNVIIGSVTV